MLTAWCIAMASIVVAGPNDPIKLKLVAKGGSQKIGYFSPQKATLITMKPGGVKRAPKGLEAPLYGELEISNESRKPLMVLIDEPAGKPARMVIDVNRNGDLTDDPAVEWKGRETKGDDGTVSMRYSGEAMVDIGDRGKAMPVNISMYRLSKHKDVLFYYPDYAYEGEIKLGNGTYEVVLTDDRASGDFRGAEGEESGVKLLVDVNKNGKFDRAGESFSVRKPFAIGGRTYEIAGMTRRGDSFRIVPSKEKVAEVQPPPDHSVGKGITPFTAKDTDGKTLKFPDAYQGKIVLIDFWATWCPPCMEEMPHVVETYKEFRSKGFEVLGVSLDTDKSISKMPQVMRQTGMTWRQIADGKGWKAEIAVLYGVGSIPATYLVDGNSGKILGRNLRGKALRDAVEKAVKGGRS